MKKTIYVCATLFIAVSVVMLTTAAITEGNSKWEYTFITNESEMNKLGKDGWELVAVSSNNYNGNTSYHTMYFKRKLP